MRVGVGVGCGGGGVEGVTVDVVVLSARGLVLTVLLALAMWLSLLSL